MPVTFFSFSRKFPKTGTKTCGEIDITSLLIFAFNSSKVFDKVEYILAF